MVGRDVPRKHTILWIGDAVAHTGFSTVTHGVLETLHKKWNTAVLGVNYYGDPHHYPYDIYPATIGGDLYGINRLPAILQTVNPDVICIVNDPWVCKDYVQALRKANTKAKIILYMPVDAVNMREDFVAILNGADHAIAYTRFGLGELRKSGLTIDADVIPHGIDSTVFKPLKHSDARKHTNLSQEWYIVGCANRNQPRKRMDLALDYFATWAKDKPDTVKFYYHGALQDVGWDLLQLAKYYGIDNRMIITSPKITPAAGVPRELLRYIYCSFDVQMSTSVGEGWGLTTMEGMACSIPQIVPRWSALGEWADKAAVQIPCTSTMVHTGGINTVGGVADKGMYIEALEELYQHARLRYKVGKAGFDLVEQEQYKWSSVALQFDSVFTKVVNEPHIDNQPE